MRTLYLNDKCTRWRNFYSSKENGLGESETLEFTTKNGSKIVRTVKYWENTGKEIVACVKYNNKLIKVFPDTILENEIIRSHKFGEKK